MRIARSSAAQSGAPSIIGTFLRLRREINWLRSRSMLAAGSGAAGSVVGAVTMGCVGAAGTDGTVTIGAEGGVTCGTIV